MAEVRAAAAAAQEERAASAGAGATPAGTGHCLGARRALLEGRLDGASEVFYGAGGQPVRVFVLVRALEQSEH